MVLGSATLSKVQSSALAFIHSAVSKGISANETLRQLSAAGVGVRRTWGLETYASYAGTATAGYAVQNVRHDYFPSFDKLPPSATPMKDKYGMNIRIATTGEFDEETGKPLYKSLWVTSNEKHNTQWYLDKAQEYIDTAEADKYAEAGAYVTPSVIESVRRNPKFG